MLDDDRCPFSWDHLGVQAKDFIRHLLLDINKMLETLQHVGGGDRRVARFQVRVTKANKFGAEGQASDHLEYSFTGRCFASLSGKLPHILDKRTYDVICR